MKKFLTVTFLALFVCSAFAVVDPAASNNNLDVTTDSTDIIGGDSTIGDAVNNRVSVGNSAIISGDVIGGRSSNGSTNDNSVTINNGIIQGLIYGGQSTANGDANNNTVTINGGIINNDIYGGYSATGDTSNNTVIINGGTFYADIYAGSAATGTNNHLIINSNVSLTNSTLYGDILTVNNFKGSVAGLSGFNKYNFNLTNAVNGDTILTSTTAADITGSTINIIINGNNSLNSGDSITLINSTAGVTGVATLGNSQVMAGISRIFDITLSQTPNDLAVTLNNFTLNPQTKSLTHGQAVRLGLHNQATDMISDLHITANQDDWSLFAAQSTGASNYDLGTELSGYNIVTGATYAIDTGFTVAAFIEAGWGNYDSEIATIKADGRTNYYGFGLYEKFIFNDTYYFDGSLRAGNSVIEYNTNGFGIGGGVQANYEKSSTYYGLHMTAGRIFNINKNCAFDIYTRFALMQQSGTDFTIAGDDISIKNSRSMRVIGGGNFNYAVSQSFNVRLNAAYEEELDSKLNGSTNSVQFEEQNFKGGTTTTGAALTYQTISERFLATLGFNKLFGTRDGYSINAQLLLRL